MIILKKIFSLYFIDSHLIQLMTHGSSGCDICFYGEILEL